MNNRMKDCTQCDMIVGSITAIGRQNWLEVELRACVYWPSNYLSLALMSSENLPTQGKEWATFVKWNKVPSSRTALSSDLVLETNSSQLLSSRKFLSNKTLVTASTAPGTYDGKRMNKNCTEKHTEKLEWNVSDGETITPQSSGCL